MFKTRKVKLIPMSLPNTQPAACVANLILYKSFTENKPITKSQLAKILLTAAAVYNTNTNRRLLSELIEGDGFVASLRHYYASTADNKILDNFVLAASPTSQPTAYYADGNEYIIDAVNIAWAGFTAEN